MGTRKGGGIRERSSHKQLVASAKLPRLLRRRTDSSSTVCEGYTHLSGRMGLGGRKVCVECERLPRESEKRARQWISTMFFKRQSPRVAPLHHLFSTPIRGIGARDVTWRHWDDVSGLGKRLADRLIYPKLRNIDWLLTSLF